MTDSCRQVKLPSFSAMAFKTCITVIAVVYAVQIICEASNQDSSPTTSEAPLNESDIDYGESCMYNILKTTTNLTLVVNCTMDCGQRLDDHMPCVNVTYPPLNFSNPDQNYTCTVGNCNNGTCPSNGTNMTCWAEFEDQSNGSLLETLSLILQ
uniref:Evasin n=1 Tax=Rhipicephalus microplus TaxID=6941 RepID=A0A6G5A2U6_RHIMP